MSIICTVIPVVAMLCSTWQIIKNFSADEGVINGKAACLMDEV